MNIKLEKNHFILLEVDIGYIFIIIHIIQKNNIYKYNIKI